MVVSQAVDFYHALPMRVHIRPEAIKETSILVIAEILQSRIDRKIEKTVCL